MILETFILKIAPVKARFGLGSSPDLALTGLQGHLAHKKTPPPRTPQWAYAKGSMMVLGGGGVFL